MKSVDQILAEDESEHRQRPAADPLRYRCPTCWARPGRNCRRRVRGVTYRDPPCFKRQRMADRYA